MFKIALHFSAFAIMIKFLNVPTSRFIFRKSYLSVLNLLQHQLQIQQARKLQATLEDANQKLRLTYLLTDGGEV